MRMRWRDSHLPELRRCDRRRGSRSARLCFVCAESAGRADACGARTDRGPAQRSPALSSAPTGRVAEIACSCWKAMQQLEDGGGVAIGRLAGAAVNAAPLPGTDRATGRDGLVPPGRTPCLKVAGPCGPCAAQDQRAALHACKPSPGEGVGAGFRSCWFLLGVASVTARPLRRRGCAACC
jgi:hypothetical protein